MPIETCFFDMGNVLVYFSHDIMYRNVAALCGVSAERARELLALKGLNEQLERGAVTEEQFHAEVESALGRQIDIDDLRIAVADIFHLNESIVPLLQELKSLGIRLVLLSNTSITHLRFIKQQFDVLSWFDDMTTSCESKALKPETAIYNDALARANCPPEHCFYTDDIEDYVVKARQFGINAEVYSETTHTRAALRNLGVPVSER